MQNFLPLYSGVLNWLFSRIILLCLGMVASPIIGAAQQTVQFETRVPEGNEVAVGIPFEIQFSVNHRKASGFKPPALPQGFQILSGPNMMASTTIINGQATEQTAWTFEIVATKPGNFTIGPATVNVQGRSIHTKPYNIRITDSKGNGGRINLPPGADDDIFLTAEVYPSQAYVNQQVTYRVKLYTILDVESADLIEQPKFENFYFEEKRRFDTRWSYANDKGNRYAVKTLFEFALFPQKAGEYSLESTKIRVNVEKPSPFAPLLGATVPELLETPALTLKVLPLPDSLPPGFSGGVGEYFWEMALSRDTVATGEAVALTVTMRGDGDSKNFNMPRLTLPASLEGFEPNIVKEESYENGERMLHSQTVEYVLMPQEPGKYVFEPTILTFNPDSGRFVQAFRGDSIVIFAIPGLHYGTEKPLIDTSSVKIEETPPTAWHRLREHLPLGDEAPWWLGLMVLPVVLALFFLSQRSSPRKPKPQEIVRPIDEARQAREQLAALQERIPSEPAKVFYDELLKILHHYLSAKLDIPLGQLTKPVVQAYLADRRTPEKVAYGFIEVWERCERMVFAPESSASKDVAEITWRTADEAVRGLERWISGSH